MLDKQDSSLELAAKRAKFLELAKYSEQLREKMDEVREEMNTVMTAIGVNQFIQDSETLTVYKITKPKGTFMYYRDIDYVRTAQEGESKGSLSKKEAEEAGFVLKK